MFLRAGTLLGRYEILSLLGQGGMGEVYKANDARLARPVAIKVLPDLLVADPIRRARLEQEAQAMSALNHPHVCALHDIGRVVPVHSSSDPAGQNGQGPIDFLVMEYCDGETLERRLAKRPLKFEQLLALSVQMAEGVDAAHRHGLTHCDLKPSNIMLTGAGVKLLDFGVTRMANALSLTADEGQPRRDLASVDATADGECAGTPRYMAPEQLEGRGVDARTDLFALGAILYEMAAGRKAFDAEDHTELTTSILENDPPPLRPLHMPHPMVLRAFDRVVRKCLAKDPTERWQNARDLATELMWIAEDDGLRRSAETASRSRARKVGLAVAVVCAAIASAAIPFAMNLRHSAAAASGSLIFEVVPPSGIPAGPIVSPDGRYLAFLATGGGAGRRMWIKPLDSLDPRALPGTEGASNPFWSADSQSIGFFASGKLKTIEVHGGGPVDVCDAVGLNRSGTWNRDGIILLSAQTAQGDNVIQRVPASGGTPEPVTQLEGSPINLQHTLPEFLPDGRHFLYLALTPAEKDSSVFLGSLDGGAPQRLLDVRSQALYAEPGFLLYSRGETLLAQPFDAAAIRFTGPAKTIATDVAFTLGGRAIFSVSQTGVLVYRAVPENLLEWVDRRGGTLGTIGVQRRDIDPAASPDGARVAVSRYDPVRNARNIWILDLQSGSESRLTFDNSWDTAPLWSRDGNRVVYASGPTAAFTSIGLYEKAVNGSSAQQRLGNATGYPESWTGEGRSLIYGEAGPTATLWVLPPAGPPAPLLMGRHGELSPDGRWLAYSSTESGIAEVFVRPFPEGHDARWQISTYGGVEPRWRADGGELYHLAANQDLMAVPVSARSDTFQAGRPVRLFKTRADVSGNGRVVGRRQYVAARDGQRFLINQVSANLPSLTVIVNWAAARRS